MKNNAYLKNVAHQLHEAELAERADTKKALELAKEALQASLAHGFLKEQVESKLRIGRCYWINGNFSESINYLNEGLSEASNHRFNELEIECLNALGNVYAKLEIIDQAISYYYKALSLTNKYALVSLESKILNNIGTLHDTLKDYQTALNYYEQSLFKDRNDADYYGSAIAHFNIGALYLKMDKLKEARYHLDKATQYAEEHDSFLLLGHCLHSLGLLASAQNNMHESIKKIEKSVEIAGSIKDFYNQVQFYIDLAITYKKIKNYEKAEAIFKLALDKAKSIDGDIYEAKIYGELATLYEELGAQAELLNQLKEYYNISKIIEENHRQARLRSIEYQVALDKSQQETDTYRKLTKELQVRHQEMLVISEIGQSLTSTLKIDTVFNRLYENMNKIMGADCLGIGLYNEDKNVIRYELYIEDDVPLEPYELELNPKKNWSAWCMVNKEIVLVNDVYKNYTKYIDNVSRIRGNHMNSVIFAPLIIEGKPIGVMTVQSKNTHAYDDHHKTMISTLSSYLAIAINNAQQSEKVFVLSERFKSLSEQDGLTGIANRRRFDQYIKTIWQKSIDDKTSLMIAFIDIDFFKEYNDSYGHLLGDEALKKVAEGLKEWAQKEKCFVARYGGDEFVLISNQFHENKISQKIEALHHHLKDLNIDHDASKISEYLSVSIGFTHLHPNQEHSYESALNDADKALYEAKNLGRNQISFYQNK